MQNEHPDNSVREDVAETKRPAWEKPELSKLGLDSAEATTNTGADGGTFS